MIKNTVGWMEEFDCDVESALDEVSEDPKIRGQIRWMVMTNVNHYVAIEMRLKSKLSRLEDAAMLALGGLVAADERGLAHVKPHIFALGTALREAGVVSDYITPEFLKRYESQAC